MIQESSTPSSPPPSVATARPAAPYNSTRAWFALLVSLILAWLAGLSDALAFNRVLVVATRSPKIYKPILNCLFLNGVIFVGSYIVFHHFFAPLLQKYEAVSWIFFGVYPTSSLRLLLFSFLIFLFISTSIYTFTIRYPKRLLTITPRALFLLVFRNECLHLYFHEPYWHFMFFSFTFADIIFVVNAAWYSDIAEQTFLLTGHERYSGGANFVRSFTDSVYNNILCLSFIICSVFLSLIPRLGTVLYFIQLSWLYSFYCFETKWTLRGKWGLRKRIFFFEEHWVYMLGFGTPFTLAFFFFPFLVSAGVYAFLFPFFLILAVQAKRQKRIESPFWFIPQRFPIFFAADLVTRKVLSFLKIWAQ